MPTRRHSLWPRVHLAMTMELRLSFAFSCFFVLKPLYACTPFDHHVSLILTVTTAPLRIREISQCQCTQVGYPTSGLYTWCLSLPPNAPSFVMARVLEEVDLVPCCSCSCCTASPLYSIPSCPWRLNQRPDYLFLVSEAMVYVVPRTHACRPDRPSKTIFPEDVSENMTWMCLANPRIFCRVERLSSRLPTLLCRVGRGGALMSNLFALLLSTIAGEPKYIGAKLQ